MHGGNFNTFPIPLLTPISFLVPCSISSFEIMWLLAVLVASPMLDPPTIACYNLYLYSCEYRQTNYPLGFVEFCGVWCLAMVWLEPLLLGFGFFYCCVWGWGAVGISNCIYLLGATLNVLRLLISEHVSLWCKWRFPSIKENWVWNFF